MTEYTTEPMSAQLTGPQTARLGVLRGRLSATTYTAERDEPQRTPLHLPVPRRALPQRAHHRRRRHVLRRHVRQRRQGLRAAGERQLPSWRRWPRAI